ncbi:MAG TPA: hypothetical protein PKK43_12650 [Spirochaetota bacterium]|mgnify:CR=1 FL=1|nr:hypothetical protein [Spirochaetota bacterium]
MAKSNMLTEITKELGLSIPKEIIDESGEKILTNPEKVERALMLISRAQENLLDLAEAISNFFDENLYLYIGLTKPEAAERLFGMSVSTVRNLQLINERIGPENRKLALLGVSKLAMIAKLPDAQRSELITNGELHLADGSIVSVEEIAGTAVKDMESKLRAKSNEVSALRTQLKESDKAHKEEVKQMKGEIEELEALTNIPEEDRAFYDKVTKKREIQNIIFEAQSYMHSAFMALGRIDGDAKDAGAAIEGFMTTAARKLLDLEEQFGASAGYYKTSLKAMAGEQ